MSVFNMLSAADVVVLVLYILIMVYIGVRAGRRIKKSSDFSSAGQKLSWVTVAGSTIATCMGANMVLGKYDLILKSGLSGIVASLFWWVGWIFLLIMAKRLRASNQTSIPSFFAARYNDGTKKISSYCVLISAVASCAAQFLSIGSILSALGICSMSAGVWIGAAIIILFTIFSGLLGVALTDTVQSFFLLIVFGLVFPIAVIRTAGGWDAVLAANTAERLQPFTGIAPITMVGWAAYYSMSTGSDPAFAQRIFAAKDTKNAVAGQIVAWALTLLVVGFVSAFPGLAIGKIFPDLTVGSQFTPLFIATYFPAVVRGFLLAILLSLMLTSGDTYLLLLSSTAIDDIIRPRLKKECSEKKLLIYSRVICVAASAVICLMALYVNSIYQLFKTGGGAYGAGVFFPLILGCFWKKAQAKAINIGMFTGTAVSFLFDMFLKIPLGLDVDGVIIGGILCVLICVFGSLAIEKKRNRIA